MSQKFETFQSAEYWLKRIRAIVESCEPAPGETADHVSDDVDQIDQMIELLGGIKEIYCNRDFPGFDAEIIASVNKDIDNMVAEIKAEIDGIVTDRSNPDLIRAGISRLIKISNWYESDGDPRSIRMDMMFAPLWREDPDECGAFNAAQGSFGNTLDEMIQDLQKLLW